MSACDEGWGEDLLFENRFCPCALRYGGDGDRVCGCELDIWHEWIKAWGKDKPPDSCPHAAALKAVVENPELVLVAVPKDASIEAVPYPLENSLRVRHMIVWWESQ